MKLSRCEGPDVRGTVQQESTAAGVTDFELRNLSTIFATLS
jgi:hypothetical protein